MSDNELTEKDRAEIEVLAQQYPCVAKMLATYVLFTEENMMLKLKYTLLRALDTLNNDVMAVAEGEGGTAELVILKSDDKVFDRIWKMLTEIDKVASVLELSKDGFLPKSKKKKKDGQPDAQQVAL
jgi:hypothetical protein